MQYKTLLAGAYQIEKTVDRSTYSVLCMGRQAHTEQEVRLRLWPSAHVTSSEEQQRIQAEVAAIQAIQHPHILPILEVRAVEQGVFLVSASAPGGSLHTQLNRHFLKPLPLTEALLIVQQVGQALHALHKQGITHGNLTPLAVFFNEPDHVLLGEFHLRSIPQSIQGYQPLLDENIPRCWYMAPEQFSGHLDAQTDQYALGCLAYALLTGRVPFAGSSRAMLWQKHRHDKPRSLVALNADVPATVEVVIFKALAKSPTERYGSVQAFLHEWERAVSLSARAPVVETGKAAEDVPAGEMEKSPVIEAEKLPVSTPIGEMEKSPVTTPVVATGVSSENVQTAVDTRQDAADLPVSPQPAQGLAEGESANVAAPFARTKRAMRTRQTILGPLSGRTAKARGFTLLVPMIALVIIIVLVLGSWLALTGGTTLSRITGGITPSSTGSTQGAQGTATSSFQPTTAETVNAIGLHKATPTVGATNTPSPTSAPNITPTASPTTGPTATPTAPPAVVTLLPVCITMTQGNTNIIAEFGYTNNGSASVTIPAGPNNFLSSSNDFQSLPNPPTSFNPGTNPHAFQVQFSNMRRSSVTWSLNGRSVTASHNSPMC